MKCISCQNEIQDGSINCPLCGAIQQINNGVTLPGAQPVQAVQPVQQPVAPVQPVAQPTGVPVPPAVPQQPVAVPVQPQAPVDPTNQPQALGTVSQREAIVQGIQQGTLINGQLSAAEVIGGKEHQNFINEEKKENKKKLITTAIIVGVLIALIIGGYVFYNVQYHSSKKRIALIFDGLATNASKQFNNSKVQTNSGEYKLDVQIDRSNKKYGITTEGKFAYDLTKSIDLTTNISSINYGEELLDNKQLNLELYINDSKLYFNPQNFLDKYIYTDFEGFNTYRSNISQNNIAYNLLVKNLIKDLGTTLSTTQSKQEIATSTISGKKANIIKITLTSENRKSVMKRYMDTLASDHAFVEQYKALTGKDEKTIETDFADYVNKITYNPNETYVIEFHTGIFNKEFIGAKLAITSDNSNVTYTVKTVSNGYKFKCINNNNQVFDLTYTKTKGMTSTSDNTNYSVNGTVFYDNAASNIDIKFNLVENKRVEVPEVKVKDSVNIINLTEDDMNNIISKADQYPKLKTLIITPLEGYFDQFKTDTPYDNCSPDMNCMSIDETPATEDTTPTE